MTGGKKAILIFGAVLIVVLLYALIFIPNDADSPENKDSATSTATTTDEEIVDRESEITTNAIAATPTFIKESDDTIPVTKPEFDRPVSIPDSFPNDTAKIIATKIANAIAALEEDSTSFDNWLTLANLRSQIEDFDGTVEIYEYLGSVFPENDVSFLSLGNLQHLRLRDFESAEKNLKQAITNNITNVFAYTSLHELYRDSYKIETLLAENILLEGIVVISNDLNLLIMLADYYKSKDRIEDAIDYFTQAKNKAKALGNKPLVDRMTAEIEELEGN